MVTWPRVSIIIVNWNAWRFVERCLMSLIETDYSNFEIIFVDNGSRDGSLEVGKRVLDSFDSAQLIINERNVGFAEANNQAVSRSSGEYIVFLNVDTEMEPDWLRHLVRAMEADRTIGAAQPKLLSLHDRKRFDSAGDFIDCYGFSFRRGGDWGEVDVGQYDSSQEIFSARGACMIVRRRALEEIGLFDPDYFMGYEDIDLCWRARLRGYRVILVPRSRVYHRAGPPREALDEWAFRMRLFHNTKNRLSALLKNFSASNLLRHGILAGVFLLLSIPFASLHRTKPTVEIEKARAMVWALRRLREIWRKRLYVQRRIRSTGDCLVMRDMLRSNPGHVLAHFVDGLRYGDAQAARRYFLRTHADRP